MEVVCRRTHIHLDSIFLFFAVRELLKSRPQKLYLTIHFDEIKTSNNIMLIPNNIMLLLRELGLS